MESAKGGRYLEPFVQPSRRPWVAEKSAVPLKPGSAGGGKGPRFKTDARRAKLPSFDERVRLAIAGGKLMAKLARATGDTTLRELTTVGQLHVTPLRLAREIDRSDAVPSIEKMQTTGSMLPPQAIPNSRLERKLADRLLAAVLTVESQSIAPAPTLHTPRPPRLSIVVLPFTNIGGGEAHDSFVDGITESLTTDLARIPGTVVIGRNTAFTYKGKAIDARQVGRELGVRYVM